MTKYLDSTAPGFVCHGVQPQAAGFTLIELLIAVAISAILACVSFPSFQGVVLKARRADAWATVMQLQMAQERYRANHVRYGSLTALAHHSLSSSGHYALSVSHVTDNGYRLHAQAQGLQRADASCRHLQLRVEGLNRIQESGPTEALGNSTAENKKCWGL
jgi:type IV pilus assembly protein PilE